VVRTDRPRSFIIMQVELVSGPAGSWLKPQKQSLQPWDARSCTVKIMAHHADIKVKMKKQPRPEFWVLGWRRKSRHVQSFEDAAAWNPFEVRDRITFFPCRSSSIALHACSGVPCSRTPEQDQLSKTKLHSSAQFLCMPAVAHSAPELKNRTNSRTGPALNDKVT
jgi:hypothetical protein